MHSIGRRRGWLLLPLLLAVMPLYLCLGWNHDIGESGTDGPAYLMMAEHYAGHGTAGLAHDLAATTSRFPPVYPLLLALAGGATDLLRAHLLTMGCLLAALLALYSWLRWQQVPALASSLFVLAMALAPGSWLLALTLQSEYLYLLWSLLALTLMVAGERRHRSELLQLAALCVALAALTRTVGVILIVPLLISLRSQPRQKAFLSVAIAVLPLLLWRTVHASRLGYDEAIAELYHGSGLSGFAQRMPAQWQAIHAGVEENLVRQVWLSPLAGVAGLVSALATLPRLKHLRPDAWYLLFYTVVILLWPFPEEGRRFVWAILPLLLAQPLLLIHEAEPRAFDARRAAVSASLWLIAMAVMVVPAVVHGVERWREADRDGFAEGRHYVLWYGIGAADARRSIARDIALKNAMRAIPEAVPENDCIVTTRPDLVIYFGKRISISSPAEAVPEPLFRQMLERIGCHYVFGLFGVNALYPTPLFPVARIQAWSEPVFVSSLPGDHRGDGPGSTEDIAELVRLK